MRIGGNAGVAPTTALVALTTSGNATIGDAAADLCTIKGELDHDGTKIGFYGTAPVTVPTIAGTIIAATVGTGLNNLLTALANLGLIVNSTSIV